MLDYYLKDRPQVYRIAAPRTSICSLFHLNIGRSVKLATKLIRVAVVGLGWRSTGLAFQSCTAGIMSCGHLLDYEALFN